MESTSDPYDAIAEWYDVEHDALSEDVECYLAILAPLSDGPVRVLEMGSGTGRTAAKLAAAGHRVTGIEPSRAMRERCQKRLSGLPERVQRRIHIAPGSATDPGIAGSERFDAVLFGLNVLAHVTTVEERLSAIRRAGSHLNPGGHLILDVDLLGPRRLLEHVGHLWWQGSWRLPESASHLSHTVSVSPMDQPDLIELQHLYDVFEQGGVVKRTLATMTLAILSYGEVISAVTSSGFTIQATHGGHDLSPFEGDSPRLIIDARLSEA